MNLEMNFNRIAEVGLDKWEASLSRLRASKITMKKWYSLFPKYATTWRANKIKLPQTWHDKYDFSYQCAILLHEAMHLKQRANFIKNAPLRYIGEQSYNIQYLQAKSRLMFELEAHREEIRWYVRTGVLRKAGGDIPNITTRNYLDGMSKNIIKNYNLRHVTTSNKLYSILKDYFYAAFVDGYGPR